VDHLGRPLEDIEKAAAQQPKVALIVVDTLAVFFGDHIDDPGSSSAWTPLMMRLVRIARDHESAVLLLHHARKSDGEYRASTAIGAAVDVVLGLRTDPLDTNARHLTAKGRFAVPNTSVCLTENGFAIASGEISLEARVLAFVQAQPGCSMRQVTQGVAGRDADISAAVHALITGASLVNNGTAAGFALSVAASPPATASGSTAGNAPV
jgi:predicted ATP-dependent serine protease